MNKGILTAVMALCLAATGCGGGGGGGGGSSTSATEAIPLAEYSIFSSPPSGSSSSGGSVIERDGNPNDPADDYVLIERDSNGLVFTYRDVSNRNLLGDTLSMRTFRLSTGAGSQPSDFSNSGNYIKASAVQTIDLNHTVAAGDVKGTFTATDTLEMGGKKLGLTYADFGMWKMKANFNGTINNVATNVSTMSEPENWTVKTRNDAHKAYFAAGGNGTANFSGNAMGVVRAHNGGDDVAAQKFAELYGTANMQVNLLNRKADLSIDFADFYRFDFTGLDASDNDGEFENGRSSMLSITQRNNNTGISFDGQPLRHEVDGQFFGPSRTNPTEAVGEAEIKQIKASGPDRNVEVDIVFGMKR